MYLLQELPYMAIHLKRLAFLYFAYLAARCVCFDPFLWYYRYQVYSTTPGLLIITSVAHWRTDKNWITMSGSKYV